MKWNNPDALPVVTGADLACFSDPPSSAEGGAAPAGTGEGEPAASAPSDGGAQEGVPAASTASDVVTFDLLAQDPGVLSVAGTEPVPLSRAEFDALSPAAKALIRQAVAAAKVPTSELAAERSRLAAERQDVERLKQEFKAEQARIARAFGEAANLEALKKAAEIDPATIDPVSDEGQRRIVDSVAAKRTLEALKPVSERFAALAEEEARAEATARAKAFTEARPEFRDPEFSKAVLEEMKAGSSMERAYHAVLGARVAAGRAVTPKAEPKPEAAAAAVEAMFKDGAMPTSEQIAAAPPDVIKLILQRLGR